MLFTILNKLTQFLTIFLSSNLSSGWYSYTVQSNKAMRCMSPRIESNLIFKHKITTESLFFFSFSFIWHPSKYSCSISYTFFFFFLSKPKNPEILVQRLICLALFLQLHFNFLLSGFHASSFLVKEKLLCLPF